MSESDAELLLKSGIILKEATKCSCDACVEFIKSVDDDFYKVATRFADLKKEDPGLLFKALIENWDREYILKSVPALYE